MADKQSTAEDMDTNSDTSKDTAVEDFQVRDIMQGINSIQSTLANFMMQRNDSIPSASHNVYAYRFTSTDGTTHEGSDDDGEHGAWRSLLSTLRDNKIENSIVVVSRWFSEKIRPRRFTHIKTFGLIAAKNSAKAKE
jgi:hypothetical protein